MYSRWVKPTALHPTVGVHFCEPGTGEHTVTTLRASILFNETDDRCTEGYGKCQSLVQVRSTLHNAFRIVCCTQHFSQGKLRCRVFLNTGQGALIVAHSGTLESVSVTFCADVSRVDLAAVQQDFDEYFQQEGASC